MDDKEANIDLLFRNGLRDYEVLPPTEVWDKVSPVIRKNQRPYIIFRAAATIAILATLGFLTFTWNKELSNDALISAVIPAASTGTPETEASNETILADAANLNVPARHLSIPAAGPVITLADTDEKISEESIANRALVPGLREAEESVNRTNLIIPVKAESKNLNIDYFPTPYIPEMPSTDKNEKWTFAALVSPTYLSAFGASDNQAVHDLGNFEQPVISYAGGVALAYKVSKRLSVQSGLYYTSYGNQLSGITSFGGFQNYDQFKGNINFEIRTTNGTVSANNEDVYLVDNLSDSRMASYFDKNSFDPAKASLEYLNNSLRQNLGYIELPVVVKYKVIDRTFDFNLIGGLSSNLLVNNSVYASVNGGKYEVGRTEGLNTIIFSSSLGMGMEYNISRNLSLNLEPTFRYYLSPFNNFAGMNNLHPYSFGVFSGLSYKF